MEKTYQIIIEHHDGPKMNLLLEYILKLDPSFNCTMQEIEDE